MIKKCDTFNSCSIVLTRLCTRNWAACVTLANCSITTGFKMLKSVVVNHIHKHIDLEWFRVLLSSDSHSSWEHQPWYKFPTAYSSNLFDLLMLSVISYQRNELMSMCVCVVMMNYIWYRLNTLCWNLPIAVPVYLVTLWPLPPDPMTPIHGGPIKSHVVPFSCSASGDLITTDNI